MSEAVPTIFIDNDQTRVTEWRFAPGAATGWHRHEMNYVVVPLMDGQLRIVGPNGEASIAELKHGVPLLPRPGCRARCCQQQRL